jgi:superfamily II helicase
MKSKLIMSVFILFLSIINSVSAQDRQKAESIDKVVWFGVDFTAAKFTLVTDDPAVIVNQYLKQINMLILQEPEKFNIKKFFNKAEVINSVDFAIDNNLKINPSSLVITDAFKLTPEDINKLISKYDTKDKSGTGMIFIAENLNKSIQTATFYVCFFDIATKKIIDSRRMVGKPSGIGFRNYWAGSIYNIMKEWSLNK